MRGRSGDLAVAAVVGLAVAVMGVSLWFWFRPSEPPEAPALSTLPVRELLDPEPLVEAFTTSRTVDHALVGTVTRTRDERTRSFDVRRARSGDRGLDEIGPTSLVTSAGEIRACELLDGEVLCAAAESAPTIGAETEAFARLFDDEFVVRSGPRPEALAPLDERWPVTCWTMEATTFGIVNRYGDRSTLCFDDDVGVLVGRFTERSGGDTETFLASELRANPSPDDLEPTGA